MTKIVQITGQFFHCFNGIFHAVMFSVPAVCGHVDCHEIILIHGMN